MPFRCNLSRIFALSLFSAVACCSAFSQAAPAPQQEPDSSRKIELPIQQWLSQGERIEIPWRVAVSRPVLTFQLRSLVRVTAEIDSSVLQRQNIQRDLHFIVKVAPEHGRWEYEESYSHFRVDAKLASNAELQMVADLYLQPGDYTVATMVYDAVTAKRNLAFSRIQAGAFDQDPPPQLLGSLPKIQFLAPPDKAAPLGAGRISLPVATQRPVLLDLIVDLSTQEEREDAPQLSPYPNLPRPPIAVADPWPTAVTGRRADRGSAIAAREMRDQSELLQMASVVSALDLKQGCIQVTALDILRRHTILSRTSAGEVDWDKLRDQILSPDKAMVSVADLKGSRESGRFFQQAVEQTMAQSPDCKLNAANPLHMIAILSRGVSFPSGSGKPKIESGCNCKIFYLQESGRDIYGGDDLKGMLKPLSPRLLQFGNPQDFRRELFEFTRAMEQLP